MVGIFCLLPVLVTHGTLDLGSFYFSFIFCVKWILLGYFFFLKCFFRLLVFRIKIMIEILLGITYI